MITITVEQLLKDPVLFNSFSNDPEDYQWDAAMASQWCEDNPDATLRYDGMEWTVYNE
jgi:hypothetical protein